MPESDELPPAMPKLIMDIELGEDAEMIDFDYQTFYEMAKAEDISDKEIDRLTIHLSKKPGQLWMFFNSHLGIYKHRKRQVKVNALSYEEIPSMLYAKDKKSLYRKKHENKLSPQQRGDIVVRHEIGHWVNTLGPRIGERRRLALSGIIKGGGILSLIGTVAAPAITKEWYTGFIPIPLYFAGALGGVALEEMIKGKEKNYDPRKIPHEIPAYEYEARTRGRELLTYIPREDETGTIPGNE